MRLGLLLIASISTVTQVFSRQVTHNSLVSEDSQQVESFDNSETLKCSVANENEITMNYGIFVVLLVFFGLLLLWNCCLFGCLSFCPKELRIESSSGSEIKNLSICH